MCVQLHERPQPIRPYGYCVAYSDGVLDRPMAVGAMLRFPPLPQFVVAKRDLEVAVRAARPDMDIVTDRCPDKRHCVRPLKGVAELTDDSRAQGTIIVDLDGVGHFTRSKTDLQTRERELFLVL